MQPTVGAPSIWRDARVVELHTSARPSANGPTGPSIGNGAVATTSPTPSNRRNPSSRVSCASTAGRQSSRQGHQLAFSDVYTDADRSTTQLSNPSPAGRRGRSHGACWLPGDRQDVWLGKPQTGGTHLYRGGARFDGAAGGAACAAAARYRPC
eukprot:scaffold2707_cov417-Prasinococcus_capsulatus_cf.AAC.15